MALLVALSAIVYAVGAAPSRPIIVPDLPHSLHAAPLVAAPVAVVSSQAHAQDELGQYSYSYSNPLSAKVETKTVDGITRGGYSYLDSHGIIQSVNYVSDDYNGFRVAASNLPLGPVTPQEDEPLVAHEKAKAIEALQEAAVKDILVSHENEIVPPHVVVSPASPVVHEAPAVYSTPAPPLAVSTPAPAPVTYVTPSPQIHVPHSPAPVVYVTPAPYRVSSAAPLVEYQEPPQSLVSPTSAPAVAHSYATVELDSSDIPAPAPAPGAYFRPSPAVIAHSVPLHPAPEVPLHFSPEIPQHPAPEVTLHSAGPAVYAAPPVVQVTPAPAVHHAPVPLHPTPEVPLHSYPEVDYAAPAVHPHAAPVALPDPVAHAAPAVAAPVAVVSSQAHAQDELGQYSYSYSNPLSAKVETKTVDGITRGGYSYLDSHGIIQSVNYVSDDVNGFRVAASNLPTSSVPVEVPVPDSDDVAAAKQLFFAKLSAGHAP